MTIIYLERSMGSNENPARLVSFLYASKRRPIKCKDVSPPFSTMSRGFHKKEKLKTKQALTTLLKRDFWKVWLFVIQERVCSDGRIAAQAPVVFPIDQQSCRVANHQAA